MDQSTTRSTRESGRQAGLHSVGGVQVYLHPCVSPWVERPQSIVFHHGLGACGACWNGWINALTDRYQLVFFDMRGHGQSPVSQSHDWTVDAMVADLASVVDAMIPAGEPFHLVGESIGGTSVLAYAGRYVGRLASLTISNGAHQGGSLSNLSDWQQIIEFGGMPAWSRHMMTMRFLDGAIPANMSAWYEEQQAQCDPRSILAAVQMLVGADLSELLSGITVPTLLLHPDSSPFIPVSVVADLQSKLPDAQLNVFARTRHGLPFSHAAQCAAVLCQFLDTLDQHGGGT